MTIDLLLKNATRQLQIHSSTPDLDAELLLAHTLKKDRAYLHTYPEKKLTPKQCQQFNSYIKNRIKKKPIAYILGYQHFWTLDLKVNQYTLIPRPETELIVELALKKLPAHENMQVADLGTGSGAIALAIATERPHWQIIAIDRSLPALKIAKQNAKRFKLTNVQFYSGNWCDALPNISFDAIISNPPYISENDPHLSDLSFEPNDALVAGKTGLEDLHLIIEQAHHYLKPHGWLILEHGYTQAKDVKNLLVKHHYHSVEQFRDLAAHLRASIARKS